MRPRSVTVAVLVSLSLLSLGTAQRPASTLPERMADTGGGTQLITAVAARTRSTTGTVTWWDRKGGRWVAAGSAKARFGANGLTEGATREQGTNTTPHRAVRAAVRLRRRGGPSGTRYTYRPVLRNSWWCQDTSSRVYNRWTEPRAADCRASQAEHLITYRTQYAHALVVDFNYRRPVRGRGAGIFLHVNGHGATAGCVSVPKSAMRRILRWADPARAPHLAVGTTGGRTAITRY